MMIVEAFASGGMADNLNPIGPIFYSASTQICVPASLSQEVGLALGTHADKARLREVISAGEFARAARCRERVQPGASVLSLELIE